MTAGATVEAHAPANSLAIDDLPIVRTLVFAPHPDDESIGAGALLAAAARRGASITVIFITDGDNNPWPQRVARRRWRLTRRDHQRWGRLRRREARRALAELGVHRATSVFVGLPDDGLATLEWQLRDTVLQIINEFAPTLLVIPSIDDFHPDHRATHRAVLEALARYRGRQPDCILSYVVHGNATPESRSLTTGSDEMARKRSAIGCHRSQLLLSRGRFMRYAAREEQYAVVTSLTAVDEARSAKFMAKMRHIVSVFPTFRRS